MTLQPITAEYIARLVAEQLGWSEETILAVVRGDIRPLSDEDRNSPFMRLLPIGRTFTATSDLPRGDNRNPD